MAVWEWLGYSMAPGRGCTVPVMRAAILDEARSTLVSLWQLSDGAI